jgi:multiple sugar transport system ATP-binding protein
VMRDGKVQQVDAPGRLYEEPANVFVAAFIGSPAMNLAQGILSDDNIMLGSTSIPLDRERRPVLQPGGRATVGIRPESFEDAAFASRDLPTIDVQVEVLESIGSDAYVFFHLDAEQVIVEEALSDEGADDGQLLADNDLALFAARVDSRTRAQPGERLTLAIEPSQLYFFSPETGESLLRA